MRQYFAFGFFAFSAVLSLHHGAAFARSTHSHRHHHTRTIHGLAHRDGQPEVVPAVYLKPADDAGPWVGETGVASYYGPGQDGRRSASGLRFDQRLLTAAHPWLPFGTKVRVTLAERSVIVTITDRLYSSRRIVDLSVAAAKELGMMRRGLAKVTLAPA